MCIRDRFMSKYQDLMFRFSRESLKEYLGHDMVDVLIEWMPTSDGLLTKKKLIDMIEYLHGVNILKNRSFRKDLLLAMEARDIFRIRDDCLSSADRQINDANTLIDIICRKSWGKNKITKYLLSLWEYPSDSLDTEPEDITVEYTVNAVSYTHLDVYKRQGQGPPVLAPSCWPDKGTE